MVQAVGRGRGAEVSCGGVWDEEFTEVGRGSSMYALMGEETDFVLNSVLNGQPV